MVNEKPVLFKRYPDLEGKVPWVPVLTGIPTHVEKLTKLEEHFKIVNGEIYIKRDDKDHNIYGGNKLRKFEFIFGEVLKRKKKGIITSGGIGTNHGMACAIIAKELSLKWTPLLGFGSPLGTIGFINALFELKEQIDKGILSEPEIIFVAAGSTGTAAGLTAGCKLMGLKTKVYFVNVSRDIVVNPKSLIRNANKAIKYLRKRDKNIPDVKVNENDFKMIKGYLGSGYGIITKKSQNAVDLIYELEGKVKDFRLETTYTGKALAAMFEFLEMEENKSKKVLFWNTYNSNDLVKYLKQTNFNFTKLPKKFHKFYEQTRFQCWQITDCPENIRNDCFAYLNHEYRFWKITECKLDDEKKQKAYKELSNVIQLEDA